MRALRIKSFLLYHGFEIQVVCLTMLKGSSLSRASVSNIILFEQESYPASLFNTMHYKAIPMPMGLIATGSSGKFFVELVFQNKQINETKLTELASSLSLLDQYLYMDRYAHFHEPLPGDFLSNGPLLYIVMQEDIQAVQNYPARRLYQSRSIDNLNVQASISEFCDTFQTMMRDQCLQIFCARTLLIFELQLTSRLTDP